MEPSNVELARRGFQAVARGDFDQIAELLAPDVRWHAGDPDYEYACKNRDQALRFMRGRRRRGAGPLPELLDVVDAGNDQVVVVMRQSDGTETANLTTFRAGKVVEMVHYDNAADALAAAGAA
jgi:ketosteroid isomerase-like protein